MNITNHVAGYYKIEVLRKDGSRRLLVDWFPNIITDAGLNAWGTTGVTGWCRVGTGSATPVVSDTALGAQIASTNGTNGITYGRVQTPSPIYGFMQKTFRFALGAVVGNISEVGIGWASTGSTLFSRSLISPTITVLADEQLDVTYELRIYPPTTDTTGVVTIGGIDHTWTARPAYAAWTPGSTAFGAAPAINFDAGATAYRSYDGGLTTWGGAGTALGDITGALTGGSSADSNASGFPSTSYLDGSLTLKATYSLTLTSSNFAGGIKGLVVSSNRGQYQIVFSPAIPKDATKIGSISLSFSWARRP